MYVGADAIYGDREKKRPGRDGSLPGRVLLHRLSVVKAQAVAAGVVDEMPGQR